jgi:alpha-glucosidase
MKKGMFVCFLILFIIPSVKAFADATLVISSPDKQIEFRLFSRNNKLQFTVLYKNRPVIVNSELIMLLNDKIMRGDLIIKAVQPYEINEQYPWLGVHATAVNNCKGVKIAVQHAGTADTLDIRVFNDGIAFRMILPAAANASRIPDEATVFNLPAGSTLWYHDMEMHYESVHVKKEISRLQCS